MEQDAAAFTVKKKSSYRGNENEREGVGDLHEFFTASHDDDHHHNSESFFGINPLLHGGGEEEEEMGEMKSGKKPKKKRGPFRSKLGAETNNTSSSAKPKSGSVLEMSSLHNNKDATPSQSNTPQVTIVDMTHLPGTAPVPPTPRGGARDRDSSPRKPTGDLVQVVDKTAFPGTAPLPRSVDESQ